MLDYNKTSESFYITTEKPQCLTVLGDGFIKFSFISKFYVVLQQRFLLEWAIRSIEGTQISSDFCSDVGLSIHGRKR